jgi:nitrilase
VVAKASDGPGVTGARIDLDLINRVRTQIPVARHKVMLT